LEIERDFTGRSGRSGRKGELRAAKAPKEGPARAFGRRLRIHRKREDAKVFDSMSRRSPLDR
jgi:hypothetical protein